MTRYYTHPNIQRYLFTKTIDGLLKGLESQTYQLVTHTNRQLTKYFCMDFL